MVALVGRFDLNVIESTLTDAEARAEATRCVQCTAVCDKCVEVCPNRANFTFLMQPVQWDLPVLVCRNGALVTDGTQPFQVAQARQILHVDDWCNECDDCQTFCVHEEGKPYVDKPRLFLTEEDFLLENDNAFHITGDTIRRREGGQESRLAIRDGALRYEDDHVRLDLTPDFKMQTVVLKAAFREPRSLVNAAEMAIVFKGIKDSLPFLLV
jgi:putative selenate reductase